MSYYLLITFVISCIVDYKYIYYFIDSKFLYTSVGSKLEFETNNSKQSYNLKRYGSLEIFILTITFFIFFSLNYTISSIAFNTNPLLIKIIDITINLTNILEVNQILVKFIYHISCALCILFLVNKNIKHIKKWVILLLQKILKKELTIQKSDVVENIIARDEDDECFIINDEDLYKNVLITGSIGTGKTSGAIARLTYSLIKSGKGGIVLDAKGNFVDTVESICKRCGRSDELQVISNNSKYYFELLDRSKSPLELANRLKQIITLLSPSNNTDSYWLDKVENVLMNFIILMRLKGETTIMELHRIVIDDNYLKQLISEIKIKLKEEVPDDKTAFEIYNVISFIENEYFKLDNRVNSIIKSEITRLTIPLITDYDIYNQFCVKGNKQEINFRDNKIIVLSLNIGENKALSKIIATFLKLSYQKYILSNISSGIPSFFIADEFQEFCNVDDAHFLSLSREAKCINIISTQSYSSLKSTIKDSNATNVIIQNLVNKIWFRNDDNYTISEIIKQLGKRDVIKENKTISETGQESKKNILGGGFRNKKSSIAKALNFVTTKENEYDENFFSRELKNFEALIFMPTGSEVVTKKIIFERWK